MPSASAACWGVIPIASGHVLESYGPHTAAQHRAMTAAMLAEKWRIAPSWFDFAAAARAARAAMPGISRAGKIRFNRPPTAAVAKGEHGWRRHCRRGALPALRRDDRT